MSKQIYVFLSIILYSIHYITKKLKHNKEYVNLSVLYSFLNFFTNTIIPAHSAPAQSAKSIAISTVLIAGVSVADDEGAVVLCVSVIMFVVAKVDVVSICVVVAA